MYILFQYYADNFVAASIMKFQKTQVARNQTFRKFGFSEFPDENDGFGSSPSKLINFDGICIFALHNQLIVPLWRV
jgi:hypothetical protein